jgi:hypothetical protein
MKELPAIPKWPRWYCSLIGHWGYLREVESLDGDESEYVAGPAVGAA